MSAAVAQQPTELASKSSTSMALSAGTLALSAGEPPTATEGALSMRAEGALAMRAEGALAMRSAVVMI